MKGALGPTEAEGGIIPADSTLSIRLVVFRDDVVDEDIIAEGQECIRASERNVNAVKVLVIQLELDPLQVGGGVRPEINHDVVDFPPEAGEGLPLAMWGDLVMESPEGSGMPVLRDVRLKDVGGNSMSREFSGAEVPPKDAALVDEWIRLDQKAAGQGLGDELHGLEGIGFLLFEKQFGVESALGNEMLKLGKPDGLPSPKIIGSESNLRVKID
jgi:hypothetical protein